MPVSGATVGVGRPTVCVAGTRAVRDGVIEWYLWWPDGSGSAVTLAWMPREQWESRPRRVRGCPQAVGPVVNALAVEGAAVGVHAEGRRLGPPAASPLGTVYRTGAIAWRATRGADAAVVQMAWEPADSGREWAPEWRTVTLAGFTCALRAAFAPRTG